MRKTATLTFEVTVVVDYDDDKKLYRGVVASAKDALLHSVDLGHFIGAGSSGTAKSKTAKVIHKEMHWKTWSGKKTKCPVPPNTRVDICLADGRTMFTCKAGNASWTPSEAHPHANIAKWRHAS
jgi:hypothetical protein